MNRKIKKVSLDPSIEADQHFSQRNISQADQTTKILNVFKKNKFFTKEHFPG
jgi:hypothetical protein